MFNVSDESQFKLAKMQIISEENAKANRLKSEIISKINDLCLTGISKETRKKKINEIIEHVQKNSDHYINLKNECSI